MEVSKTDRLVIRRLCSEDLEDFALICGDSEVMRYVDDGRPLSRESVERWISVSRENYRLRGWGCFAVAEKCGDSGETMIGFAGFARPPDRPGIVELIYAFSPEHWGRGYATEASAALVDFAFEEAGLIRLEATVDPENQSSKRVLEKVGFLYELRRTEEDGSTVDYYAIEPRPRERETT